jgi:hypothetical protein
MSYLTRKLQLVLQKKWLDFRGANLKKSIAQAPVTNGFTTGNTCISKEALWSHSINRKYCFFLKLGIERGVFHSLIFEYAIFGHAKTKLIFVAVNIFLVNI